nr:immunoglobulin light chain junction region [Macaca mulatta]
DYHCQSADSSTNQPLF